MKSIKLLYPFKDSAYQSYKEGLADALVNEGMPIVSPLDINIKVRRAVAKIRLSRTFKWLSKDKHLIVLCAGYPDYATFPFGYTHSIIPIMWDTWPRYWERIIASFKRHNVKLAFFTQKQVAEYIHSQLPNVECVHLPEGLSPQGYKKGDLLQSRKIDILELGRLYKPVHDELLELAKTTFVNHIYAEDVTRTRLFDTFEDLTNGLAESKIVINYPRSVTHTNMAGGIETMTQRYWECMYSRCVMVGHAPKELVDLIGYNPVIECFSDNIREVAAEVLNKIESYQQLVDKNYETAIKYGSWESRVGIVLNRIETCLHQA